MKDFIAEVSILLEKANDPKWSATQLMRDRVVYNILAALRGPDFAVDAAGLKHLTIARIRGIVCPSIINTAEVNTIKLTFEQRAERDILLKQPGKEHFTWHYVHAVEAIKFLYNFDLETETETNEVEI